MKPARIFYSCSLFFVTFLVQPVFAQSREQMAKPKPALNKTYGKPTHKNSAVKPPNIPVKQPELVVPSPAAKVATPVVLDKPMVGVSLLKFEEAEEAYREKNYAATLELLDEINKLIDAPNFKTHHLRIMAQYGLLKDKVLATITNNEFTIIDHTRNEAKEYLERYELLPNEVHKYREVYKISEEMKKYPKTFAELKSSEDQKRKEIEQKLMEKLKIEERSKYVVDSLCKIYKFKPNLTVDQFKAYNSNMAVHMIDKNKSNKFYTVPTDISSKEDYSGPNLIVVENEKVWYYSYIIKNIKYKADADKEVKLFNSFLSDNLKDAIVDQTFSGTTYTIPNNKVKLGIRSYYNDGQSNLTLYFTSVE